MAAEKVSGTETILGAQEIRGLWRVYPLTRTARNKLLIDNLTLRRKTVQVYDNNPFIVRGGSGEEVPVTKVWISDIPISVDGKDIGTALVRLGCVLRSSLINEKIRNKDGKLTRFLTGRRFVFVNIPERPLEWTVKIGGFTARLYHKEQPRADPQRTACSRCLERGHLVSACPDSIRCRECRQEGHKRGDPVCDAVSVWGPQGSVGQRGDTQVSNAMEPPTPNPQVASRWEPPTPDPRPPGRQRQGTPVPARDVRQRGFQRWRAPVGGSPAGHRRHAVGTAESESHRQTAIGNQEDQG